MFAGLTLTQNLLRVTLEIAWSQMKLSLQESSNQQSRRCYVFKYGTLPKFEGLIKATL